MKNGVPFDVAFSLPGREAMAYAIILGQMDGREWDWRSMSWKKSET